MVFIFVKHKSLVSVQALPTTANHDCDGAEIMRPNFNLFSLPLPSIS